ncbi:YhgE/Pip domain-containing protein [Gordonia sp. (in: high G+C Gram-positive bacteria)]|uniref:YhgE/Pip domain-containing protein n=1 Tax=Gordonia sp. (in: high G+C Gram-positive bacteria) TaxID=84139 RepID=UPI0039E57543
MSSGRGPVAAIESDAQNDEQARAAIGDVLGHPRFWIAPVAVVIALMSLMAAVYMGAVVNTRENLHDFHVALVNEDHGGRVAPGEPEMNIGKQIADQLVPTTAKQGIVLQPMSRADAMDKLYTGKVYGVIAIDANFTNLMLGLARSAVLQNQPVQPRIDVFIHRGSGTFASSVTTIMADEMSEQVNKQAGEQLLDNVRSQVGRSFTIAGASQLALSHPVNIVVSEPHPLPDGAANGLSAFYFTLLLVLAGFTGAMMVQILVDAQLGQMPIEFGPLFLLRRRLAVSRWGTLASKWTIMLIIAVVQSGLFLLVCSLVGTELPNAFILWAYSVLVIFAVGVTASSMMAAFGNPGLLMNLIFFVILGLPSSGGTVPLEASPRLFSWIAAVEPMHLVYYGVRSILYFDADPASGLTRSVIMTVIGLVFGLVLGIVSTKYYDGKGWFRRPNTVSVPPRLAKLVDADTAASVTLIEVPAGSSVHGRHEAADDDPEPPVSQPNVTPHR